ncbi:MAG: pyrroline-5-carboxylate reductase [Candidatus Omnitrophica bacterium]|nr:pyrroline-5-carboxylate reductase [Candidatus Omnitrophota bacterium]
MQKNKVAIVGYGNMGAAIANRIKSDYSVFVFDQDRKKTKNAKGLTVKTTLKEAVTETNIILLAVKPQDLAKLLKELTTFIHDHLIISIAAGVQAADIESALGTDVIRVVRAMPNMPIGIGCGICCLYAGRNIKTADIAEAKDLFETAGAQVLLIDDEDRMDVITALSGSGPGYYCYLRTQKDFDLASIHAQYVETATKYGFSKKEAEFLWQGTGPSTEILLEKTGQSPEDICRAVTSKGGTTEEAIKVLQRKGSLKEAIKAAIGRARELAKDTHEKVKRSQS